MINSITSKLYYYYKYSIYPRINDRRGATRIASFIDRLAFKGLDTIEERKTTDLFTENTWNNLIILDGARHDIFEEVDGETSYRYSKGSMSKDYIRENFSEGDFSDYVYVTANPFFNDDHFESITGRRLSETFFEVFHTYENKWDDENGTVMPESVKEEALTAKKLFPEKKLIIHFMQPHHPFVGSDISAEGFDDLIKGGENMSEWKLGMKGEISREELWQAYRNNLNFVMPYVESLQKELEGKTVLTSDHGNLVGENGIFGHPGQNSIKLLRKVPYKKYEQ